MIDGLIEPDVWNDGTEAQWRIDALCAQTDPEIFFPNKGGSTREAKSVCARCPVAQECLEYAVATDQRYGVWGGKGRRALNRLRKMRGSE